MILKRIHITDGRFAFAVAFVVRHNDAVGFGQWTDKISVQIAPGWLPVEAYYWFARSLIHVVHTKAYPVEEVRLEGKGAVEGFVGGNHSRKDYRREELEN